jgi:hypothetical protein
MNRHRAALLRPDREFCSDAGCLGRGPSKHPEMLLDSLQTDFCRRVSDRRTHDQLLPGLPHSPNDVSDVRVA